jgi:hypothetical protein
VPPHIKIDPEIRPTGQYVSFVPDTDAVSILYVGLDGVDPLPSALLKDPRTFVLDTRGLAQGRYRFAAVGASAEGQQARTDFAVVVGTPGPTPPGPTPPGPTPPGPTPPGPTPSPIAAEGLHVLMLYESADLSTMPKEQLNAMRSAETMDYLNKTCPKEGSPAAPAWRIWDKDLNASNEDQVWKNALGRAHPTMPWIVLGSKEKGGFEGPLPKTQADLTALLKKYGG